MNNPIVSWYVKDTPTIIQIPIENATLALEEYLLKAKAGTLETYLSDDANYVPTDDFYAGSLRPNDVLEISFQVWNNRWGQEDCTTIPSSANIAISFDTLEDSQLLKSCLVKVGDSSSFVPLDLEDYSRGRIGLGKALSGLRNNGSLEASSNFTTVWLRFGPVDGRLRNGLKNMLIDLEFNI